MAKSYHIVELRQGSASWHHWRLQGFTATDAKTLMTGSLVTAAKCVVLNKVAALEFGNYGGGYQSEAMLRGIQLEPEARAAYCNEVGVDVFSVCIQHNRYKYMRASLDGLAADGSRVVEIKCGERDYAYARDGKVNSRHKGQLQHILMLTGLKSIDYYCYHPDFGGILIKVPRNQQYINRLRARVNWAGARLNEALVNVKIKENTEERAAEEAKIIATDSRKAVAARTAERATEECDDDETGDGFFIGIAKFIVWGMAIGYAVKTIFDL